MSQKREKRIRRLEARVGWAEARLKRLEGLGQPDKREDAGAWRVFLYAVILWAVVCVAVLAIVSMRAGAAEVEKAENTAQISEQQNGRIPGDDLPARENAWADQCEAEENRLIEEALLAAAHRIDDCEITYYCAERRPHICGTGDGITASGEEVAPGITCAVDPRVIPLGADVLVDDGSGELHYYRAADKGAAIKGNHVDLCVKTHAEALELGRKTATVYWVAQEEIG